MVVAILAAILAAILDFSVSSRIFACYQPDFHYRGANDAKSTVKKTLSFQAGYISSFYVIISALIRHHTNVIYFNVTTALAFMSHQRCYDALGQRTGLTLEQGWAHVSCYLDPVK